MVTNSYSGNLYLVMEYTDFVVLESRGITSITDGREFFVYETEVYDFAEPVKENDLYMPSYAGKECDEVIPVKEGLPFICDPCLDTNENPNVFRRSVIFHSTRWMYTLFACEEHPTGKVYLDIFPKTDSTTAQNWTNSFEGPIGIDQPVASFLKPYIPTTPSRGNTRNERYKERVERRYFLTPDGVIPEKTKSRVKLWTPGWLSKLNADS